MYDFGRRGPLESCDPGAVAYHHGSRDDFFARHQAIVDVALRDGSEKTLARFGQGESFGEIGVLNDGARSISVKARTDTCLLKIPKSDFLDLVREMPQLALSVMRDLARRMDGMISKFESMQCS